MFLPNLLIAGFVRRAIGSASLLLAAGLQALPAPAVAAQAVTTSAVTTPAVTAQGATSAARNWYPAGARNAVSLSFDDARPSQADVGLPLLARYQVKATFYLLPRHAQERLVKWQQALQAGHELGNHSNSHLCTGNFQWLRHYDAGLEQVDLAFMQADLASAQQFFRQHFQMTPQHFAYPCGQTFVGRGEQVQSYVPLIARQFLTGRTFNNETANLPSYADFAQLQAFSMDNRSFAELRQLLEQQREENKWLILAGHEIGSEGLYTTRTATLEQLIQYLQDPANGYWLAPVGQVAAHLQQQRRTQGKP